MKTRTILVCETCEKDILKPDAGVILRGSIFPANSDAEPILGKAAKDGQPDSPSQTPNDAGEGSDSPKRERGGRLASMAYCLKCFTEALGLTPQIVSQVWQNNPVKPIQKA